MNTPSKTVGEQIDQSPPSMSADEARAALEQWWQALSPARRELLLKIAAQLFLSQRERPC